MQGLDSEHVSCINVFYLEVFCGDNSAIGRDLMRYRF